MKWKSYTLQQQIKRQEDYQWIESWEDVATIDIVVSNKLYTNVANDVIYRIYAPVAISKFKDFEKDSTYKIINTDNEYLIDSFNNDGRYSQLLLKEVVLNG